MIKSKKTETLGYRGLMEQNLKNQDYHHAFLYGEKLFSINPNIEKHILQGLCVLHLSKHYYVFSYSLSGSVPGYAGTS